MDNTVLLGTETLRREAQVSLDIYAYPTSSNNGLLLCFCHNNSTCCKDHAHLKMNILYWVYVLLANCMQHPSYQSKMFGLIGWPHAHIKITRDIDNNSRLGR